MSFDTIPKDLRGLRACLVCSLIKVAVETKQFFHPLNKFHFRPSSSSSMMDVTTARVSCA